MPVYSESSLAVRFRSFGSLLAVIGICGCGPSVLGLHAVEPETCSAEYRFTAVLSGNVLSITLAKDLPGEGEDEIPAVLSYKQPAAGALFELTPDPTGAGDIEDAPPAMQAKVDGARACLAPMDTSDSASDECLQSWLSVERCYVLQPE
jgi:hypothetical protein